MGLSLGSLALILSNILLCLALAWLRNESSSSTQALEILMLGNLITGVPLLAELSRQPRAQKSSSKSLLGFLSVFSGIVYGGTYIAFLAFPQFITLADLMVARALAPTLAVILVHGREDPNILRHNVVPAIPSILVLVAIASLEAYSSEYRRHFVGMIEAFSFVVVMLTLNQTFSRLLSRLADPVRIQSRVGAWTFATVALFLYMQHDTNFIHPMSLPIGRGAAFAIAILSIQGFFLTGLARTSPLVSALLISSSVPTGVIIDLLFGRRVAGLEVALSIIYVLTVALTFRFRADVANASRKSSGAVARRIPNMQRRRFSPVKRRKHEGIVVMPARRAVR